VAQSVSFTCYMGITAWNSVKSTIALNMDTALKLLAEFLSISLADICESCSTSCVVSDPSLFEPYHLTDIYC